MAAKNYDRVQKLLKLIIKWTVIVGLICTILFEVIPGMFIRMVRLGRRPRIYFDFAVQLPADLSLPDPVHLCSKGLRYLFAVDWKSQSRCAAVYFAGCASDCLFLPDPNCLGCHWNFLGCANCGCAGDSGYCRCDGSRMERTGPRKQGTIRPSIGKRTPVLLLFAVKNKGLQAYM